MSDTSIAHDSALSVPPALPFWLSLIIVPVTIIAALYGGWTLLLLPVSTWWLFLLLDVILGADTSNADPRTQESALFWHRAITIIWFPVQFCLIFGTLYWVTVTDHLNTLEELILFFGVGIASGTIGINYAHELCHQRSAHERLMADLLLGSVLYSHFRSEHVLVHHRYVATPRDPVTARYNESFFKFYARVIPGCFKSAFEVEKAQLARKGLPWWDQQNPFWRYAALQLLFLEIAIIIGGFWGLLLFVYQAATAVFQLELVDYVEHYGLTRKHLGDGKYEPIKPRHSWNADFKSSNWLLINLQRHSDHHYNPTRRFPLLQTYSDEEAPQLPFSYPLMTLAALYPRLWRKWMNPRVLAWRQRYYPEITEWVHYKRGTTPWPK